MPESNLPANSGPMHAPYDADRPLMMRCACGGEHAPDQHGTAMSSAVSEEAMAADFIEATLVKSLFPVESVRRSFLKAVGASTARAAFQARDREFGDGRARVDGPEIRDADGRLID